MRFFKLKTLPAIIAAMACATACSDKNPDQHLAAAKAFIAKGSDKSATIELKNALSINPKLTEARFLLGVLALKEGRADSAEMELREAKQGGYDEDEVDPEIADAMLAGGKAQQLIDQFHGATYQDTTATARMQTDLAIAYRRLAQMDKARKADDAALAAVPGYAPAAMERIQQDAARRDFAAASSGIEQLLAQHPHDPDAWKLKGDVLLASNRDAGPALEAYRHAIQEKPNHVPANVSALMSLMQLGQLDAASAQLESLKKVAPPSGQIDYLAAQLAFQKKDFQGARVLTQKMLQRTPDSPLVLQLAGAIELQSGAYAQAEADLDKALQLAPHLALARRLLVTTYLRSGRPGQAATALDAQVQKDGIDPAMFELAGETYLRAGDATKATAFFQRALELTPGDASARTGLALSHMVNGRADAAFDELQTIVRDDKGDTADLAVISGRLSRHEYAAAVTACNALEKKQPTVPLAADLRGRAQLGLGDRAAARASFEHALVIDPSFAPAAMNLAVLDQLDHKPEDAKKRLEAVLAKNPGNAQVLLALAQIAASSGGDPNEAIKLLHRAVDASPENVGARLTLIESCLGQKDYHAALEVAQAGVSRLPDNPALLEALGRVQQISGNHGQAVATFGKLIAMSPTLPQPHVRQAEALAAGNDLPAAEKALRAALAIQPDLLDAQGALAILAIQQKHFDDAVQVAQTVQKQRPTATAGYMLEGLTRVEQKKWDEAAAVYRRGIDRTGSTDLAIKLHAVLLVSASPAETDGFATGWMRQHPKDIQFLAYLGDGAISRKDYEGAEKQYQAALRVQPDNPSLLNNMAWIEGQLKRDGAIELAQKANRLAPNQPDAMDTLAVLLGAHDQLPQAIALESKAVAMRPANPKFRLNLAKLYIQARDSAHAKTELDALAKLGDKFASQPEVTELRKRL
ncbi:MAG: XrtA/PEP-CTERM system TPR-repeat protein PrsT [Vitreoscilla sp.]